MKYNLWIPIGVSKYRIGGWGLEGGGGAKGGLYYAGRNPRKIKILPIP